MSSTALTIPGGINVEGRLLVDNTANGTLNTTALVVQGKLSIREPSTSNTFTLNLFGTDDVQFLPHSQNQYECGVNVTNTSTIALPCNLGKKPIAVLGGTLDVDALPQGKTTCPSWVNLKSKQSSSPPVADDLIPDIELDPANPQGIESHSSRYPSAAVVVHDMGGGEFKLDDVSQNRGLRVRFKPAGSLERTNAVGKTVTLSWKYKVDDSTASPDVHLGWKGKAK